MTFIPKKILGIHGKMSDINKASWQERKRVFSEKAMDIEVFQFPKFADPSYEDWEQVFREIDFSKYDAIYTNSLGGMMTLRYMYENGITTDRLVMSVPGVSFNTLKGIQPNIEKLYNDFGTPDLSSIAKEIIVISVKDDEVVPYTSSQDVARMTAADFILLETGGHGLVGHLEKIVDLVKYGNR